MKKLLIALGLATAAVIPFAASAHTDVSLGLNLGGPAYYEPEPYYYGPEVVYYDYGPYYYGPRYYRGPRYESRVVYRYDVHGRRYYDHDRGHHYGHDHDRR